jgi:chromosome segregation ATPase
MRKRTVNGFSPSTGIYTKTKERRSIKENLAQRAGRSLTQQESIRVLQEKHLNQDIDHFASKEDHPKNSIPKVADSPDFSSTCKNLEKIRESIKEIRNEGLVVQLEVQKLKQQFEQNLSFRDSYSKCKRSLNLEESRQDFNSPGIQNQIFELKQQVKSLSQRLYKGEELIKSKNLENSSLQFQAFRLASKLEKIRAKKEAVDNSKCSICQIF